MKQQDSRLSSPQWPLGPAGASGSKALVGGVPWASEVSGQDQFAGHLGADGENADRDRSASGLPRVFEPAAATAAALAAGNGGGFRDRLAAFVRNSPVTIPSASLLITCWVNYRLIISSKRMPKWAKLSVFMINSTTVVSSLGEKISCKVLRSCGMLSNSKSNRFILWIRVAMCV